MKLSARETYDALGFAMTIETDGNVEALHGLKDAELLKLLNATLSVHEEDGTVYTELKADYPKRSGILYSLRLMSKMPQNMSYGLKGIAEYLSLEKEALDAKIRIHDSIGRCLLITKLYILKGGETGTFGQSGGEVSREAVSLEWDKVIKEISGGDASRWDILERAEALGVKVRLTGELPKEEHLKDIVDTAVTVHITNMLRHTGYRTALIRTGSFGSVYIMELTQDGDESDYEIRETGGLSNLRRQVESAGGVMEVSGRRGFLLTLTLPKEMTAG
ncbi:MAG: hypothetical protein IJV16_00840 [Lachnospiraceae bacterium]|nr:hypothetical protein [Lachnospiraceae bacterium]